MYLLASGSSAKLYAMRIWIERGSTTVSITLGFSEANVWSASISTFLGNAFDTPKNERVGSRWYEPSGFSGSRTAWFKLLAKSMTSPISTERSMTIALSSFFSATIAPMPITESAADAGEAHDARFLLEDVAGQHAVTAEPVLRDRGLQIVLVHLVGGDPHIDFAVLADQREEPVLHDRVLDERVVVRDLAGDRRPRRSCGRRRTRGSAGRSARRSRARRAGRGRRGRRRLGQRRNREREETQNGRGDRPDGHR